MVWSFVSICSAGGSLAFHLQSSATILSLNSCIDTLSIFDVVYLRESVPPKDRQGCLWVSGPGGLEILQHVSTRSHDFAK